MGMKYVRYTMVFCAIHFLDLCTAPDWYNLHVMNYFHNYISHWNKLQSTVPLVDTIGCKQFKLI